MAEFSSIYFGQYDGFLLNPIVVSGVPASAAFGEPRVNLDRASILPTGVPGGVQFGECSLILRVSMYLFTTTVGADINAIVTAGIAWHDGADSFSTSGAVNCVVSDLGANSIQSYPYMFYLANGQSITYSTLLSGGARGNHQYALYIVTERVN